MNSKPPFIRQERLNTCAIACLRRILAYKGTQSSEADPTSLAALTASGLDPQELANLARRRGLIAVEKQLDRRSLFRLIRQQRFPIAFLYRRIINGMGEGHAVVPIRATRRYVTLLDPLRGERRVSIRKFEEARRHIGRWVVVWKQA